MDYVSERMQEHPAASFPRAVQHALNWFELRSGLPSDKKFGKSETLKLVLDSAELETSKRLEETRRAPRFPLSLVAAMELAVARDTSLPAAARVVLWSRLVKIYGSLRMDDLQRMKPHLAKLTYTGLSARLLRTKTTGPGKKTRGLQLFIPRGAALPMIAGFREAAALGGHRFPRGPISSCRAWWPICRPSQTAWRPPQT